MMHFNTKNIEKNACWLFKELNDKLWSLSIQSGQHILNNNNNYIIIIFFLFKGERVEILK